MFIYLVITPEIIKKSRRNSNHDSPIGLAIRDAGIEQFSVTPYRAVIKIDGVVYESKFRGKFRKFQDNYCSGKSLSPFDGEIGFFPLSEIQQDIRTHIFEKAKAERTEV